MDFIGELLTELGLNAGAAFPFVAGLGVVLVVIGLAMKGASQGPDSKNKVYTLVALGIAAVIVGGVMASSINSYCDGLPETSETYGERLKCAQFGVLPTPSPSFGLDRDDILEP